MPAVHPCLTVLDHPLVAHKLARLRAVQTAPADFRRLVRELAQLMAWPLLQQLPTRDVALQTPLEATRGKELAAPVTLVPVLRAGLAMAQGLLDVFPEARVGHIGLARDEHTGVASTYYTRLPADVGEGPVLLLDPMLATGGSCRRAIDILREHGAERVTLACLVAAPEGLAALAAQHPEVPVVTAALDRGLDEQLFIRPGLGDAGDRSFGTL